MKEAGTTIHIGRGKRCRSYNLRNDRTRRERRDGVGATSVAWVFLIVHALCGDEVLAAGDRYAWEERTALVDVARAASEKLEAGEKRTGRLDRGKTTAMR